MEKEGKSKFESLSEDLMVKIFLMMAENIKAVVRLRCISKSWRRLVNSDCLPKLACKGELAEVDFGSKLILTSRRLEYLVDGGVVVREIWGIDEGLLLNRLSSSPLMYCVSNLDATSWVVVNGPLGLDSGLIKLETATLVYSQKDRVFQIEVWIRVNCSSCDKYIRSCLRTYNSKIGWFPNMLNDFRNQVCETCRLRAFIDTLMPKKAKVLKDKMS